VSRSEADFVSERLSSQHDRAAFSCEVEPLDRYLKQQASQDVRKRVAVTYVLVPAGNPSRIAGYYTLCADSIPTGNLPDDVIKQLRLPHYDRIPATLIARMARDVDFGFIPFTETERRLYVPMRTIGQLLSAERH
jgi:hypothetical protein